MKHQKQSGFAVVEIILAAVALVAIGAAAYFAYTKHTAATPQATTTSTSDKTTDPYVGWKTYSSETEKSSFKYPADWVSVNGQQSIDPNADVFAIESPDRDLRLTWVSVVSGVGGACDMTAPVGSGSGCAQVQVVNKEEVKGAPGLYVVSGIITTDAKIYKPWIAIQDGGGLVKDQRAMGYDLFDSVNSADTTALFSTGGIYADGPELSLTAAKAWFSTANAKQAKLILASYKY